MKFFCLTSLILVFSLVAEALPLGHESGLMGNTSSRPGDVGSILQYPSALTFDLDDSTRLYSGLMFYQLRFSGGQGFDPSTETAFVPYFTASTFKMWGYKIATYAQYSEDFSTRLSLNDIVQGVTGRSDITGDKLELGASIGHMINSNLSIGGTISVILGNQKIVNRVEGQIGGNEYLQTIHAESNFIDLKQVISLSYSTEVNFLSFSVFTPTLRVSADGQQEVRTLISNQGILTSGRDYDPKERDPWSVGVGYTLLKSVLRPSFDLRYFLPDSYTQVSGPTAASSVNLQYDGYFRVGAGGELGLGSNSLMLGFNYTQERIEKNVGLNSSAIFLGTLGVRIQSLESHPIVGLYYEVDRAATGLSTQLIGLMYSTNYNL